MIRTLSVRRFFGLFTIAMLILYAIYTYLNYLHYSHETDRSNNRCLSELNSLKYQLNVVTEYKNRLDNLLADTYRKCDLEKDRLREVMDSCLAMRQQSFICQSQFEDLQIECRKVKEQSEKYKEEMEKLRPPR